MDKPTNLTTEIRGFHEPTAGCAAVTGRIGRMFVACTNTEPG
jgi:hypothetical protein